MTENLADLHVDPETGPPPETVGQGRAAPGGDLPEEDDQRQRRIDDYRRAALAMEDPLAANVAAVNSDLLLFGYSLQQAITQALQTAPTALDEFGKLMPAIDSYMRISRQVERFAKLNQQLTAAEKARRSAKQAATADQPGAPSEETTS